MYKIHNKNSKGESVILDRVFEDKKMCWLAALKEAMEEFQDIYDCLETKEERKTLRIKPIGGNIIVRCGKYLDGEQYESIYSVEDISLC